MSIIPVLLSKSEGEIILNLELFERIIFRKWLLTNSMLELVEGKNLWLHIKQEDLLSNVAYLI